MNRFRTLLSFPATVMIALFITHCSPEKEIVLPDLPSLTTDVSSLTVTRGGKTTFEVTIAAPGKFKELDATADKGTVTLSNIVGVGTESATATVTYTAPADAGTATIHVKAIDKSSQAVGKDIAVAVTQAPPIDVEAGDIEGEWGPYVTMNVKGNVTIPEGKTLVIHEGTTVVMNGEMLSFNVDGNFYSLGSEKYPNKFTVATEPATETDIYNHVWTGITGSQTAGDMVALYSNFFYTEGAALDFNSATGKFIMQHDTVQFTEGHGVHINQGDLLVTYNTFLYNGDIDDDGLRIENGATGDVAFNVFIGSKGNGAYSIGSNVNIYNNTAIECGGSFTVSDGGSGFVYNNMIVNCKSGVLFPNAPDNPDLTKTKAGYSLYFADNDDDVAGFYPANGSITKEDATLHDIVGEKDANDPKFVKRPTGVATLKPDYDLTIAADSPAVGKGTTNFVKNFENQTVGDVAYTAPAASTTIGATAKAPATTQ